MFNLSMELRPGYKPHFIMSKTLVLFASIVMFIENSINAEERLIFRHQISATESLLITVIPTNITWQGDVPLPHKSHSSPIRVRSIRDEAVPATMTARSAYLMTYTNAVTQAQIPLWMHLVYAIKENPGHEGRLPEAEKQRFPLKFLSAFYDPLTDISGLHVQIPGGKAPVWYADPMKRGTNSPLLFQGFWIQPPNQRSVAASHFKFDAAKMRLMLHREFVNGEHDVVLIDPDGMMLIPIEGK